MSRRLLWVDDEHRRFSFERRVLSEDDRWEIRTARTVEEGMRALASTSFDVVILDQDLPLTATSVVQTVWGGCGLLYWLRGNLDRFREFAPPDIVDHWPQTPAAPANNRNIPALIISGFHDPKVLGAMEKASDFDWDIRFMAKPVDLGALRRRLDELVPGGDDDEV